MSFKTVTEIRVFETPWSELPDYVTSCFSPQEYFAYEQGAKFFKNAAKETGESSLAELVGSLDDDQPMFTYVERNGNEKPAIWFGFTYLTLEHQPQFKLAVGNGETLPLPKRLATLFDVFSGIRAHQQDEGGFHAPRRMTEVEIEPYAASFEDVTSHLFIQFFNYGNGDLVACIDDETAVLFQHETNDVLTRDLDEFLDDCFADLVAKEDLIKIMEDMASRRKK